LRPTPKIIDAVGRRYPRVRRIGFKLEWEKKKRDWPSWAKARLREQGLDALCLNFLSQIRGTKHPAYLFDGEGKAKKARSKKEIAAWISRQIRS
jgi:hypothetical protein